MADKTDKKGPVKELWDLGFREVMDMYDVSDVCGQFRNLLVEQLGRIRRMEESAGNKKDFSKMDHIVIGVVPGDGIGPAICDQTERVLRVLLKEQLDSGRIELRRIDGLTIERRLSLGESVPTDVLEEIKQCDVLLKGPTQTPKGGTLESANVRLRRELDLYANVRPVRIPEKGIDWTFFRENTEGEYALGSQGVEIPGKLAMDFKVTTDLGTRRIARAAYDFARSAGKTHVRIVTKANIMKKTDGNFSRICHEAATDYPDLVLEDKYVDITSAELLDPHIQSSLQVFVLPNLYGDIITDEAAQLQGGVGTAGSANIGDQYAMFEAVHGTAVSMIEEGRAAYANPASLMTAASMMLRHIGFLKEADQLQAAIAAATEGPDAVVVTGYDDGATGEAFTDHILTEIK